MLENDLILARYLDVNAATMTEVDVARLDRLLDLPDHELWDLIAGRATAREPGLAALVAQLRMA